MPRKRSKRPPIARVPDWQKLNILDKLALESDRGCVLVAAADLDAAVEKLLRTCFEIAHRRMTERRSSTSC